MCVGVVWVHAAMLCRVLWRGKIARRCGQAPALCAVGEVHTEGLARRRSAGTPWLGLGASQPELEQTLHSLVMLRNVQAVIFCLLPEPHGGIRISRCMLLCEGNRCDRALI